MTSRPQPAGDMGRCLFDGHFHIVEPRFVLRCSERFAPEPVTVEDYWVMRGGMRWQPAPW